MKAHPKPERAILGWLKSFLPTKSTVVEKTRLLAMVLFGGIVLTPLIKTLPLLGWDWYYYFTAHNPELNLYLPSSVYPPYTRLFIDLLTWLDWRSSYALMGSLTLVTLAMATWQAGGRWVSIFLALFNPPVIMLLWVGHPDGLALLGVITGFLPLALIKPQITIWAALINRKWFFGSAAFLLLSNIVWPLWPLRLVQFAGGIITHREVLFANEATIGWAVMGWPIAALGVALLLGAGPDPLRLMAAGSLISPYLMPYHLAILSPAIGAAKTWRKALIWVCSILVWLGTGLGGWGKLLIFLYPLAVFWGTFTFEEYRHNLNIRFTQVKNLLVHFTDKQKQIISNPTMEQKS